MVRSSVVARLDADAEVPFSSLVADASSRPLGEREVLVRAWALAHATRERFGALPEAHTRYAVSGHAPDGYAPAMLHHMVEGVRTATRNASAERAKARYAERVHAHLPAALVERTHSGLSEAALSEAVAEAHRRAICELYGNGEITHVGAILGEVVRSDSVLGASWPGPAPRYVISPTHRSVDGWDRLRGRSLAGRRRSSTDTLSAEGLYALLRIRDERLARERLARLARDPERMQEALTRINDDVERLLQVAVGARSSQRDEGSALLADLLEHDGHGMEQLVSEPVDAYHVRLSWTGATGASRNPSVRPDPSVVIGDVPEHERDHWLDAMTTRLDALREARRSWEFDTRQPLQVAAAEALHDRLGARVSVQQAEAAQARERTLMAAADAASTAWANTPDVESQRLEASGPSSTAIAARAMAQLLNEVSASAGIQQPGARRRERPFP